MTFSSRADLWKSALIDPGFAKLTQVWLRLHWSLCFSFPLVVYTTFTTYYPAVTLSPLAPANAPSCVSDTICSFINAGTMACKCKPVHLFLLSWYVFCVGMNQKCVPLGHWDRLLLNQYKQIADLMVNLSEFPETVSAVYLPIFFFFINLDPVDVYNAGKVTLCCGSESVWGHYSLSDAHHH